MSLAMWWNSDANRDISVGEHLLIFFVALNHARIKKDLGTKSHKKIQHRVVSLRPN